MADERNTRQEMLNNLRDYMSNNDDDNIKFKKRIEDTLLRCPQLLYALHEEELEKELFNSDGTINEDGEWDRYFGATSNIRPFLYIPQTQAEVKNYLCYQTHFEEHPRYNSSEIYALITFTVFVHGSDAMDVETGIPRHDLIASILREGFNWSNIFGLTCNLTSNKESTTDNNYIVRTLVFQLTKPNGLIRTEKMKLGDGTYTQDRIARLINKEVNYGAESRD